jgi:hypothetical protein
MLVFHNKENDRKAAKVLRQLGFKPDEIFKVAQLGEKVLLFFDFCELEP